MMNAANLLLVLLVVVGVVVPSVVAFTSSSTTGTWTSFFQSSTTAATTATTIGAARGLPLSRQASISSLTELQQELNQISQKEQKEELPNNASCIHPATIDALTQALQIRAQKLPQQPLRLQHIQQRKDHNSDEDAHFEIYLTAGNIAQAAVQPWLTQREESGHQDELPWQTLAGRIVAIITRMDDLEWELQHRCQRAGIVESLQRAKFGLLDSHEQELNIDIVDQVLLRDSNLARRRAESLLALFLELVERPSLLVQGETAPPSMNVDFLSSDLYDILFPPNIIVKEPQIQSVSDEEMADHEASTDSVLHPIAVDAIMEALQLRARNETANPLRIFDTSTIDNADVQMAAGRLATRYLRNSGVVLTLDQQSTLAGRILVVIMRMEDLEWELHNRVTTQISQMTDKEVQYADFGLLHGEECVRSLDERLLSDVEFCKRRAEGMLALFLWLLEQPEDMRVVNFLDEKRYQLLVPK